MLSLALSLLVGCGGGAWHHQHGADHPLAGRIVAIEDQRLVEEGELRRAIDDADIILLGETHGNRDHHELQAYLTRTIGPDLEGLVFEMINTDQQRIVVEHLSMSGGDTASLGEALDWSLSGWPDWALYEPIAAAGVKAGAEIVAGNLPRPAIDAFMSEGVPPLSPQVTDRTGVAEPLDEATADNILETLDKAHCGMAPKNVLPAMMGVQRMRDALMAERLVTMRGRGKSALIAGSQHVRTDWGVPSYLRRLDPQAKIVSIGLFEVDRSQTELPINLPYDYVWFTPAKQPMGFDPCEAFRGQLNQLEASDRGHLSMG